VESQYVWALLGLLCLLILFAMMAAGMRAVKDDGLDDEIVPAQEVRPHE